MFIFYNHNCSMSILCKFCTDIKILYSFFKITCTELCFKKFCCLDTFSFCNSFQYFQFSFCLTTNHSKTAAASMPLIPPEFGTVTLFTFFYYISTAIKDLNVHHIFYFHHHLFFITFFQHRSCCCCCICNRNRFRTSQSRNKFFSENLQITLIHFFSMNALSLLLTLSSKVLYHLI